MYIIKGEKVFQILDVNAEEMAMTYDSFNAYRMLLIKGLKMSTSEFKAYFGVLNDKDVKTAKKLFKERMPILEEAIKKLQKYYGN